MHTNEERMHLHTAPPMIPSFAWGHLVVTCQHGRYGAPLIFLSLGLQFNVLLGGAASPQPLVLCGRTLCRQNPTASGRSVPLWLFAAMSLKHPRHEPPELNS